LCNMVTGDGKYNHAHHENSKPPFFRVDWMGIVNAYEGASGSSTESKTHAGKLFERRT
jgi:hypothetical protein